MQMCPGCGSTVAGDETDCPICKMSLGPVYGSDADAQPERTTDRLGNDALRVAPDIPLPGLPTPLEQLTALPIARRDRTGLFADPVVAAAKAPASRAPAPPTTRLATGTRPLVDPMTDPPQPAQAAPPSASTNAPPPAPTASPPANRLMAPPPGVDRALPLQTRARQAPAPLSPPAPEARPAAPPPTTVPRTPISRSPRVSVTTARRSSASTSGGGVPVGLLVAAVVVVALTIVLFVASQSRSATTSGSGVAVEDTRSAGAGR